MNTTSIRQRLRVSAMPSDPQVDAPKKASRTPSPAGDGGGAQRPRPAAEPATDAASAIVEVHTAVEQAFARYEQAEGSHRQQYRALLAIADELAAHTAVEQELLYPALRDRTGRFDRHIDHQLEQAHLIDLLLAELGGMIPSDRRYDVKVRLLLDLFREHTRRQELTLLPELRRRLDRAERDRLGADVMARSAQLRPDPAA
jgi:hypothetical protein